MSMNSANDRIDQATADAQDEGYKIGTVTENVDPLGLGRIQVNIPELFDSSKGEVPWVGPHKFSPFGIGPNYGVYGSPYVGSEVRVKFQNGDPHYGLAEASEYSKANANPKFKDPQTWGFKDPSGNELFVNMESGAWEFTHSSGSSVKYDQTGDLATVVVANETKQVQGNVDEQVEGNENLTIQGSLNITVQGSATISAATTNIVGTGEVNITGGGAVNITGAVINLN